MQAESKSRPEKSIDCTGIVGLIKVVSVACCLSAYLHYYCLPPSSGQPSAIIFHPPSSSINKQSSNMYHIVQHAGIYHKEQ